MKIGIAVRKDETDYFVHQSYCEFLKQNDLTFDFISLTTPLDSFDGFLIPGGNDIHSKYYRQFPYACKKIDEEMDLLDQKIILEAVRTKKPLLGICRGIQSINVFLGGSLKQDILHHQQENHWIKYEGTYYLVNSFHHQSILKLAPNLKATAYSIDGEIEMIVHETLPIIGVQFHPEIAPSKLNPILLELFNGF